MDSPTERMPIACVQCAKAKAKCDKKVPCSRCVGKQIICQSRATRRSSHMPARRSSNIPRPHSEHALHQSASFHVSQLSSASSRPQLSTAPSEASLMTRNNLNNHTITTHRLSLPEIENQMHVTGGLFGQEMEPQLLRNGFTQTPPDINIPITPVLQNMPVMEDFVPINGAYDHESDSQFLSMSGAQSNPMDFDMSVLDFMSPPAMMQSMSDSMVSNGKSMVQTPNQLHILPRDGSAQTKSRLENSPPSSVSYSMRAPPPPTSMGLHEPEAVLSSQQSWPFFQCNPSEKYSTSPPKTAGIYLEGLAQTLRNQDTWKSWTARINEQDLDNVLARNISTPLILNWSREKLIAITQIFLHKALDIHRAGHHGSREESPGASPDSSNAGFLMLPPPEVIQHFLKSYVVRHESYYSAISGGVLDANELMQRPNSKASSLLVLLMVAAGAMSTPTVEARYLASGLTEACRISLFDTIEKDIWMAREPVVLRSALLFTSLAVWSGDKWHMDIAMGQRGMYISMLNHAGMLDVRDSTIPLLDCQRDPVNAWEEWKEQEGRSRLAHSWVILDQEMSLFSDTPPLLSVANLHAPMPDSEILWQATSSNEWLSVFERTHGSTYQSPPSVLDLFTRFVDGEIANSSTELSPLQLRLLLHPLQEQVCQLRQFLTCLPDGGSHAKASRAVSKAATKARLEEISALLQQWYSLSKQTFSASTGVCWTTCANLIMYHLISLNAITSFRCIERFARREVSLGPFRQVAWLQMRCIDQAEETFFHCAQVLRLIKEMPEPVRPPWWAGAVYRVAMIGWANSMANSGSRFTPTGHSSDADRPFAIDALAPEHPSINRYLKYQEGVPMLSHSEGSLISMDVPNNILTYCIDMLEQDSTMRLTDGIKRKLRIFASGWKDL